MVANPPYGVDWKGFKSDITKDKTGRFHALPAVSDGQLLFMQHLISKMGLEGLGVVVHNGSTLFSGDAGSGESNIRKWMFDTDIVEAIIQLPTDEFFNTGIFTYLWVLNKNKESRRKNIVMMINASEKFVPMKKNKGKKRKNIDESNRIDIVETLTKFEDNDYAKAFYKEFFYFNKQALTLTNLDYKDRTLESMLKPKQKAIKLNPLKIVQEEILIDKFEESDIFKLENIKETIKELDYKEKDLRVYVEKNVYYFYDEGKETIVKQSANLQVELGCGKIIIKSSYKKATKTKEAKIIITVEITPDYQKDYEIVAFDKDEEINQKNIDDFMTKYISKPFVLLDNVIGVEINFNKIFYKPQKLRPLEMILSDIKTIDDELKTLESNLGL